jgi:hypothetical protein
MKNFCEKCDSEIKYSMKYDAYYCELCNNWCEPKCGDAECEFCSTRPEKPSQVITSPGILTQNKECYGESIESEETKSD